MASTFTANLNLEKPGIGEQDGDWGATLNSNFDGLDTAIASKVSASETATLTNKGIDADNNTISNLEVDNLKSGVLDTDISSVSSSDDTLASAKSIKAYVDSQSSSTIASDTLTFTNKTFDVEGTGNSISNIDVADLKSGVLDTDISSVSGSDDTLASAKAIKTYVDAQVATKDTLAELTDTSISSPAAGHLLIYDNTQSHFENATLTEGSNVSITNADGQITIASTDTNTQLSQEQVEDFVGGMLDGTETFIDVSYDDTDGNIDFVVPVKDEDNFASNSDTHLATQQSIKAYVDANTSTGGTTQNYILNPEFSIAQRGQTINATTPISGANNSESYCLDQWIIVSDGNDAIDVSQSTTAPTGSTYSAQISIETANKKAGLLQWLEASQCQNLIGKTVTLSFQAKSSDTAVDDFRAVVLSWDGTADAPDKTIISSFGSEGSNPTYNTNVTAENTSANLNLSTSFQKFSISCDIDTSGAKNVGVYIFSNTTTGLSTGENIFISQVQLEVGSTANDFVHENYSMTFLKCARYFRGWLEDTSGDTANEGPIANGHNMTGSGARIHVNNPVPLRATPTIDQSSIFLVSNGTGNVTSIGTIDSVGVGQNGLYFVANHDGSGIPNAGQVIVFLKEGQGGLARFFLSCELGA